MRAVIWCSRIVPGIHLHPQTQAELKAELEHALRASNWLPTLPDPGQPSDLPALLEAFRRDVYQGIGNADQRALAVHGHWFTLFNDRHDTYGTVSGRGAEGVVVRLKHRHRTTALVENVDLFVSDLNVSPRIPRHVRTLHLQLSGEIEVKEEGMDSEYAFFGRIHESGFWRTVRSQRAEWVTAGILGLLFLVTLALTSPPVRDALWATSAPEDGSWPHLWDGALGRIATSFATGAFLPLIAILLAGLRARRVKGVTWNIGLPADSTHRNSA